MTVTCTFDVSFCSLDGFGVAGRNWTGYWGKQAPELLAHRLALYSEEQRMVFGAKEGGASPHGRLSPRLPEALAVTRRVSVRGAIMIGGQRI